MCLQFHRMTATILFGRQITVDGVRQDIDLTSDKRNESSGGPLTGMQRTAGMTQITKHDRVTETAVIATATSDHGDIRVGQCVMAHQFRVIRGRIEQRRELGFRQLLPPRHARLPEHRNRETNRSGPASRPGCRV